MYAEFKCKFCNKNFTFDFTEEDSILTSCPLCNYSFEKDKSDLLWFKQFAERILIVDKRLEDLKFINISPINPSKWVQGDIDNLKSVYQSCSKETKNIIDNIIDQIFLIIYHDVKNNNVENLKSTEEKLNIIRRNRVKNHQTL